MKKIIFSSLFVVSILSQTTVQASPELTGTVQTIVGVGATIQGYRMANRHVVTAWNAACHYFKAEFDQLVLEAKPSTGIFSSLKNGANTFLNTSTAKVSDAIFQEASKRAIPGVVLGIAGICLIAHGIHNLKKTEKPA